MQNHVLILDDEADVRAAIRLQLKGTHFEILEADSFERAQELLRDNAITVDVIICDVRMPGVDGVEAVANFQRDYPNTPVIVLTGFPDVDLAVDFMKKEDVVDYLTKPVDKAKLIAAVEKAARTRKLFG
jgi:two-component system chemotaxis response regulator CheY